MGRETKKTKKASAKMPRDEPKWLVEARSKVGQKLREVKDAYDRAEAEKTAYREARAAYLAAGLKKRDPDVVGYTQNPTHPGASWLTDWQLLKAVWDNGAVPCAEAYLDSRNLVESLVRAFAFLAEPRVVSVDATFNLWAPIGELRKGGAIQMACASIRELGFHADLTAPTALDQALGGGHGVRIIISASLPRGGDGDEAGEGGDEDKDD